ncbi:MAG: hypothetical protein ACO3XO_04030 [Bdellovibrionota bacterium]
MPHKCLSEPVLSRVEGRQLKAFKDYMAEPHESLKACAIPEDFRPESIGKTVNIITSVE